MKKFLTWIATSSLGKIVIDKLLNTLIDWFKKYIEQKRKEREIKNKLKTRFKEVSNEIDAKKRAKMYSDIINNF